MENEPTRLASGASSRDQAKGRTGRSSSNVLLSEEEKTGATPPRSTTPVHGGVRAPCSSGNVLV